MHKDAPRYNIYALVHKGLRAMMGQTLLQAGRTDWQDMAETSEMLDQLGALLDFCESHIVHENSFIHPAMEARQPGSSGEVISDHRDHANAIRDLRDQAAALPGLGGDTATRVGEAMYRALAAFIAENYEHMHYEEIHNNTVLWAAYSDDEILAIEMALVASLTPAENALSMRWMLPNISAQERAGMLQGIRAHAPAEVFAGVIGMLRGQLNARDWTKLSQALGWEQDAVLAAAA